MNLILASGSQYRRVQMQSLGLDFTTVAADIDESILPGETPRKLTARLALGKAQTVAESRPGCVVVGCDQVGVFDQHILTKPGSSDVAFDQLRSMRGREVTFWSALAVIGVDDETLQCQVPTFVRMRDYSDREIRRYIELDEPYDCAGSFKSESLGPLLFESVRSEDPSALVGLPLIQLAGFLRRVGLNPLA